MEGSQGRPSRGEEETKQHRGHTRSASWQPYTSSLLPGVLSSSFIPKATSTRSAHLHSASSDELPHLDRSFTKARAEDMSFLAGMSCPRCLHVVQTQITSTEDEDAHSLYELELQADGFLTMKMTGGASTPTRRRRAAIPKAVLFFTVLLYATIVTTLGPFFAQYMAAHFPHTPSMMVGVIFAITPITQVLLAWGGGHMTFMVSSALLDHH